MELKKGKKYKLEDGRILRYEGNVGDVYNYTKRNSNNKESIDNQEYYSARFESNEQFIKITKIKEMMK